MKSLKFTIFLKLCTLIVILGYTSSIYAQLGCCDINAASPSAPTTIGVTTYTTVDVDMYLDPTYGCEAVLSKATIPNITASYPNCTRWTFWRAVPTGAYPATPTDLISSGAAVTFNTALQQYNQVVFNVDSLLFHNANAVAPYSNTTRDIYYYVTVSNPNNPTCMSHPIMLRINLFDNIAPTVTCPSPITQTHTIACNDNIEYLCPGDLVLSDLSDNCSDEEDLTYMIEITDACGTTFGPFTEDDFLATYDCSLTDGFPFQVGLNTISHIVTDQFGNESSCITEVIIKRPDPVIGCNPGPITVALPGLNYDGRDTAYLFGNAFLSFFDDPCISGAEILTPAGTPGGYHVRLSFNPTDISSFKDTLTLTCPDVNQLRTVYIRIFDEDAIDCAGNPISRYSDYCPSTVRLIDTHGPRIICPPAVSIECDDVSVGTSPTGLYNYFRSLPTSISASQDSLKVWPRVSDNCNNLTVTYYDSIPNVLGSNCYSIYRIWTVTDNNLQFSTFASSKCIQQISIYDITRPTITSITGPATYYCTNPLPQVNLVLSDNCASATDLSNQLEVLSTISTQATALNNYSHYNYSVTRNYRVHDNCGNFRDTFHITSYIDSVAPVFSTLVVGTLPNTQSFTPVKTFENANVNLYPGIRDRDSFNIATPITITQGGGGCLANFCFTVNFNDCAAPHINTNYQLYRTNGTLAYSGLYNGTQICVNSLDVATTFRFVMQATDPSLNSSILTATIQTPAAFGPIAVCHDTVNLVLNNTCVGDVTSWDFDDGSHSYCNPTCPPYNDWLCRMGLRDMWIVRLDANGNPIAATSTGDDSSNDESRVCDISCSSQLTTSDASDRMYFDQSHIGTHKIRLYVKDQYGIDSCTSTIRVIGNAAPIVASTSVSGSTLTVNVTSGPGGTYTYQLLPSGIPQSSNMFTGLTAGTYSIRISSTAACSTPTTVSATLTGACTPPTLSISSIATGVQISAIGGGGSPYTFTLNNGSSNTTGTFTSLASGSYSVTVTSATNCSAVTNFTVAGTSTNNVLCQSGSTTTSPVFRLSDATATSGSSLTVTLTADNFTNLTSFQFTIMTTNASIVSIVPSSVVLNSGGITNSMFAANNTASNLLTVLWTNPTPVTLASGTQILTFNVNLAGASGQSAELVVGELVTSSPQTPFVVQSTGAIPACFDGGLITISSGARKIAGRVATECNASVANTEVDITGNMTMTAMTNTSGDYTKTDMFTTATLTPEKDINYSNGVSTIDLVIIQQHILGITPLTSPYKLIAADADKSCSISVIDLVELQRLILGASNDLASNTSWRFVPSDFVFANPANPCANAFPEAATFATVSSDITQNFTAIKVGDVNCSANNGYEGGADTRNLEGILTFDIEDQKVKAGDVVNVTLKANEFYNMLGYQMTLKFNNNALDFAAMQVGELEGLNDNNFNTSKAANGIITTNWYSANPVRLADGAKVFTVRFKALQSGLLSEMIQVNSSQTAAEAYRNDNKTLDVALSFDGQTQAAGDFALNQNRPNPYKNQTVISFNLPTDSEATLSIYDLSGRVLKVVKGNYHRGYNEISIDSKELRATGVLYYQLATPTHSATQRMIIVE